MIINFYPIKCWKDLWRYAHRKGGWLLPFLVMVYLQLSAQDYRQVQGIVMDAAETPIAGASVAVKGTSIAVATDNNGRFVLRIPSGKQVLVVSHLGSERLELAVENETDIKVVLSSADIMLEETVVVGYGQQKRETVVGAITQTTGKVLERTGGVSSLGAALTGNLPGLVTHASTGMPGEENPRIVIRGQNSWNGNDPLILVDGVERPEFFSQMDILSVESISVLKDASATAVFGSRGANGVIIVTTKRGAEGRAEITGRVNTTSKFVSQLPGKMDAYDAIGVRNRAIEYELSLNPASWNDIIPYDIRYKYRSPLNQEEAERYPNVDWQDLMFKDYAMAYNANVAIRGGTRVTKYFSSVDYQKEGDLFRQFENNRGYTPGYDYNRLNLRSNLDFQLTPSTKLQSSLSGTYGVRKSPWGGGNEYGFWIAAYQNPPDALIPRYSDGTWGYYQPNEQAALNSIRILSLGGVSYTTTAQLSTNFVLDQQLDMLLKGLNFKGTLAVDNRFVETGRGVNDLYNSFQQKWINPRTGQVIFKEAFDSQTGFDYYDQGAAWSPTGGSVSGGQTQRRLFYQLQLNYTGTVANDHNYTAMGLMSRQEEATGSMVPRYREDWVFRGTYNFRNKYMVEYNGAYNGSEQFAPEYRFGFFSSGGVGWNISEEPFMKKVKGLDLLKISASYGEVGADNIGPDRFLFMNQWAYGDASQLGVVGEAGEFSPYTWYRETMVGNPAVRWETAYKYNLALDFGFLDGLIGGRLDYFQDNRKDILMAGDRSVPGYYGTDAPAANLGRMRTKGFELTLHFNHTFSNGIRIWADFAMTHAKDEVLFRDDPQLLHDYQKQQGYQLGQARTHIGHGYYNSWDELYASTPHNTNDANKLPGNYHILDINGDGIIDAFDSAPYGYSGIPQNTYNTNLGFEWKGFNVFLQFYGVNNVSRQVVFNSLTGQVNRVYEEGTYWSKDNIHADVPMLRWQTLTAGFNAGHRYFYDGSYLRLKNAEIGYRFQPEWTRRLGVANFRVFVSGNNLLLWTDMPDDRESNFAGTGWASQGAYTTVRRLNLGCNVTL